MKWTEIQWAGKEYEMVYHICKQSLRGRRGRGKSRQNILRNHDWHFLNLIKDIKPKIQEPQDNKVSVSMKKISTKDNLIIFLRTSDSEDILKKPGEKRHIKYWAIKIRK